MKPLNLYMLTRVKDPALFALYEQHLSGREELKRINAHEQESLRLFTDALLEAGVSVSHLDGFYFSYTIRHIGKEFDLLKFSSDRRSILNIELKSEDVGEERIRDQLIQNRYYLGHLSEKIYSFTYVSSENQLYMLNAHDYLVPCDMERLKKVFLDPAFEKIAPGDIDEWFNTPEYLISPLGTPEKFLRGEYFLTNQQHDFRKLILKKIRGGERPLAIGIGGGAGTGKTLLLYDLAMALSRKKKVKIIHCGSLCEAHRIIDRSLKNVTIFSLDGEAAWKDDTDDDKYDYLLADEAGRLKSGTFLELIAEIKSKNAAGIFCFDTGRFRFADADGIELQKNMKQYLESIFTLSGNIRINTDLASFEKYLFDRKAVPRRRNFPSVQTCCAHGKEELRQLLSWLQEKGFAAPSNTPTGLEYERALIVLDGQYYYDEAGRLRGGQTSQENLQNLQALYDSLCRVREKLCLVIYDNDSLFGILMRMIRE